MFGQFFAKSEQFYVLFKEQSQLIQKAALILNSIKSNDFSSQVSAIREVEHQADHVTHRCVEALHKTFITPFERNDIYRLITRMDDVIDYIKDAIESLITYQLKTINHALNLFSELLVEMAKEVNQVISGLCEHKSIDLLKSSLENIKKMENAADSLYRQALAELFEMEQDAKMVIKWKEVYENLENAMDSAEDVSNIVEGVILEMS